MEEQPQSTGEAPKKLLVGEAVSFGWQMFKRNYQFLLLFGLCYIGVLIVESIARKMNEGAAGSWVIALATFVLDLIIGIGLVQVSLKVSRGQEAKLQELFGETKYLLNYFLASLLYVVVVLFGTLLLIVPGIIWAIKYGNFKYLVIDKNLGPVQAIKESGRITYGYKKKLFLLGLVLFCIVLGGALLLGVGLFIAFPVTTLASTYAYRLMIGEDVVIKDRAAEPSGV